MNFNEFYFTEEVHTMIPSELSKPRLNQFGKNRSYILLNKLKTDPEFSILDKNGNIKKVKLTGNVNQIKKLIDADDYKALAKFELEDSKTGEKIQIRRIVKTKDFGGIEKIRAVNYEQAIVQAWNKEKISEEPLKEIANRVVEQLKTKINPSQIAIHQGAKSLGENALTSFWREGNERADSTPKPDIIIGKNKISLKVGTAAQLCTSKIIGAEGSKIILSSLEGTKIGKDCRKRIEEMVSKRSERKSGNKTTFLAKSGEDLERFNKEYFDKFHKELTQLLNEGCNQDPQFKRNFVLEAIAGDKKFKAEEGKANILLSCPYDGSFINFKPISSIDLDKIVQQTRLFVAFKTSGGPSYSSIRASTFLNDSEILLNYFENKASEIGIDHKILNEGIKDWFVKIFNIIKQALIKGLNFVLSLFGIEVEKLDINQDEINFLEV